jgi:CcmD family protein
MSYLLAAYGSVLLVLGGYAIRLQRRRKALAAELVGPPSQGAGPVSSADQPRSGSGT